MTQIELIQNILIDKFDISIMNIVEEPEFITINWVEGPSEYAVFKEIAHLSVAYNTTPAEERVFTKPIKLSNKLSTNYSSELVSNLKDILRENDNYSPKILGRALGNTNLTIMEITKLSTLSIKIRHLIENDFTDFRERIQTVPTVLNGMKNRYTQNTSDKYLEFINQNFFENDEIIEKLTRLRSLMTDIYYVNDLDYIFTNILERKIELNKDVFEVNISKVNIDVMQKLIRKENHSGRIESFIKNISMEDLENPLFGIENSMLYENNLKEYISNIFEELTPVEQELLKYGSEVQTISTLQNVIGFDIKKFRENTYLEKNKNGINLVLTDSLVIITFENKISSTVLTNFNEKMEYLRLVS